LNINARLEADSIVWKFSKKASKSALERGLIPRDRKARAACSEREGVKHTV
jgi:hypothetical protein